LVLEEHGTMETVLGIIVFGAMLAGVWLLWRMNDRA
jgi:hypothetical protein